MNLLIDFSFNFSTHSRNHLSIVFQLNFQFHFQLNFQLIFEIIFNCFSSNGCIDFLNESRASFHKEKTPFLSRKNERIIQLFLIKNGGILQFLLIKTDRFLTCYVRKSKFRENRKIFTSTKFFA